MAYTAIDDPTDYFRVKLYNGNNNPQNIVFDEVDTNMQPDIVWIKSKTGNTVFSHVIGDSVRGGGVYLHPDTTATETSNNNVIATFNSNGFSVGGATFVSEGSRTYVSWSWKESATSGCDIATWTGNGSAGRTVAHSLSAVPSAIWVKCRNEAHDWAVFHHKNTSAPATDELVLNGQNATLDTAVVWNDTLPDANNITLGTRGGLNANNQTHVGYIFTEKKGFSKFGSYAGNGNANGPFVHLGFRPAFIMFKRTDATNSWMMGDTKMNPFNVTDNMMRADTADAQQSGNYVDFLSNGFKPRLSGNAFNNSSGTYVYFAWAESPFVNSNGVPNNAR